MERAPHLLRVMNGFLQQRCRVFQWKLSERERRRRSYGSGSSGHESFPRLAPSAGDLLKVTATSHLGKSISCDSLQCS